jgi:hypothetical protein
VSNDIAKRRSVLESEVFSRREEAIKAEIRALPPREQLRLAADFAEKGKCQWAVNIARLAVARLEAGEEP